MKKITIYSDGSSLGNPGFGGWGTVLQFNGHTKELSGSASQVTNNQMELQAAMEGFRALKEPCDVMLVSDSKYVIDGLTKWINNWIKNNWKTAAKKPVKNKEIWQEFHKLSSIHKIDTQWVKGHAGHPQNERCDFLARDAAEKLKAKNN